MKLLQNLLTHYFNKLQVNKHKVGLNVVNKIFFCYRNAKIIKGASKKS